eukprot:5853381-Prymnesium_polylepis.1
MKVRKLASAEVRISSLVCLQEWCDDASTPFALGSWMFSARVAPKSASPVYQEPPGQMQPPRTSATRRSSSDSIEDPDEAAFRKMGQRLANIQQFGMSLISCAVLFVARWSPFGAGVNSSCAP